MNSWQRSERINDWAEIALNVAGLIVLFGGSFTMSLLWLMGVI